MGSHQINLIIRFFLEVIALVSVGIWGWKFGDGWIRYLMAIGVPILVAALWGVFAVPDDPSRSGSAPIPVHGILRLIIELAIFSFATWTLQDSGYAKLSWIFGVIVLIHYSISHDRIIWLISK